MVYFSLHRFKEQEGLLSQASQMNPYPLYSLCNFSVGLVSLLFSLSLNV